MPTTVNSALESRSLLEVLTAARARWTQTYVRRLVRPSSVSEQGRAPVRFQNLPQFPGSGTVKTSESGAAAVSIAGMPPGMYPENAPTLVMYTMANLLASDPRLALSRGDVSLLRCITAAVTASCHTWAAIGRLPGDQSVSELTATRYSSRHKSIIVRPAGEEEDHGTALWRHFLAVCPPLLDGTQALNTALAGLGPSLFIYGAALHCDVGETYSLHLLERALLSSLKASLSAEHQAKLGVINAHGLMIMSAAAVSGYRASFIRAVAEDALFVTEAQIRLFPADTAALVARREQIIARSGSAQFADKRGPAPIRDTAPVDDDDTVSIADTEMSAEAGHPTGAEALDRYFEGLDGQATPRPASPVPDAAAEAIRRIAAHAQQKHGLAASLVAPEGSVGAVNF